MNNGILYNRIKEDKPFKKSDIIIIAALILVVAAFIIIFYPRQSGSYAEIYGGGKLIKVMPLNNDDEFIYHYDANHKNIITVKEGKISVTYADCRDKICQNHIPANTAGSVIICLPHNLVIVVKGEGGSDGIV